MVNYFFKFKLINKIITKIESIIAIYIKFFKYILKL